MELYVSRSGSVEGPFSREKVEAMIQAGEVTSSDLGAPVGATDWVPLSELLTPAAATPPPMAVPPPLEAAPPSIDLNQQFLIDGKIPPGARGKSVQQISNEVAAGGRLVVFQYVFSILILTFRRNTDIHYIPPGKSAAGPAFLWSLIPLCFGWWGFPWGFIYTPAALWRNTAGGVDVTEPILAQLIGPQEADAVVRKRPVKGALWGLRALLFAPFILLPVSVIGLAKAGAEQDKERAKLPGYAELQQAESFVSRSNGASGQGNSPAATAAAQTFSNIMDEFRESAISSSDSSDKKAKPKSMSTWCEVRGDRCLFIVSVPDLRRYSSEAKVTIGDAAWFAAQLSAGTLDLPEDAKLAVAVRGAVLYDRMIVGTPIKDISLDDEDLEEVLKEAIRATDTDSTLDDQLIPYFAGE